MNIILEMKFGSHLYGTNTENSDLDIKAIYLPTAKEICLGTYKKTIQKQRRKLDGERNTKDDVDIEIISLDRFIELLLDGQTMALDMLFGYSETYVDETTTDIGLIIMNEMYKNRHHFLNRNVNAFVGYAKQQAAKYGQKGFRLHAIKATLEKLDRIGPFETFGGLDQDSVVEWVKSTKNEHIKIVELPGPNNSMVKHLDVAGRMYPFTAQVRYWKQQINKRYEEYGARAIQAEKNEGIDWKALSHAVRVNSQAIELLKTSNITFPRPDRALLLDIKLGKIPYKQVAEIIENGLEELNTIESVLPETPNREYASEYLYGIYRNIVNRG